MKRLPYLVICIMIGIIFLTQKCARDTIAGSSVSGNGIITGTLANSSGNAEENVRVFLIPENYNPVLHGSIPDSMIDTTDYMGRYRFNVRVTGKYNIETMHFDKRTKCLLRNIAINADTIVIPLGFLQDPGAIKIFIPDSLDREKGYFCFTGTTIFKYLRDAEPADDSTYMLFFPQVSILENMPLFYGVLDEPLPLDPYVDSLNVYSNDTTLFDWSFQWFHYNRENSDIAGNSINSSSTSGFSSKNILWIATTEGASCFDGQNWHTYTKDNSGLLSNQINDLAIKNIGLDDQVWFATDSGVACFSDHQWKVITEVEGRELQRISCVAIDLLGTIWFGTLQSGLFRYDGFSWQVYDTSNGLPSNCIRDLVVDNSRDLWCATDKGVACLDSDQWEIYSLENSGIYSNDVFCIQVSSTPKTIWIGCKDGVSRFESETWTNYTVHNASPFLNDTIFAIAVNVFKEVFIATGSGLCTFNMKNDEWNVFNSDRYPFLKNEKIRSLHYDMADATIWCGSTENGIIGFKKRFIEKED